MPIKLLCTHCQAAIADSREDIFNGMMVKCYVCGKITLISVERYEDRANRVTMG